MEFRETKAIYLQIVDLVCDYILTGKWKAGERILSVREFAVQLEVNPNTVMRAYEYLQTQSVIFNKRGIGFFIREDAASHILQVQRAEFIQTELPDIFRRMKILNISMDILAKEYQNYSQHSSL